MKCAPGQVKLNCQLDRDKFGVANGLALFVSQCTPRHAMYTLESYIIIIKYHRHETIYMFPNAATIH
jgi:hypothetical protein